MWKETINFISDPEFSKKVQKLTSIFIQYCRTRHERITQRLAQIIIRVILINPEHRFVLSENVTNTDKELFMETCYKFLFSCQNISSITLRMQTLFHGRYLNREEFKNHQKQTVMKNCYRLIQKLKKAWHNPTEDLNDMHNELVQLILIKEGMQDQDDPSAFDEMRTAVNSIFPLSALSTFVQSNQKTKMAFINEISSIATGIRLHAWYSHKAGRFMFDVGKIMKETLPKISEDIYEESSYCSEKIKLLQDTLAKTEEQSAHGSYQKLLLIFMINYNKYIKVLKESIQEIAVQTYKLDYTFSLQIKDLDLAMKSEPFTKADRVYPSFKEVARTWKSIQLEGHLLNFYSVLYQELKTLSTLVNSAQQEAVFKVPSIHLKPNQENSEIVKIIPGDVKNFQDITLEYQEFCTFYCSMGILVPCNRELGIIMHKNLCYGFSSINAIEMFMEDPFKCLSEIKQHILAIPELIITFQLETYFNFPIVNSLKQKGVLPVFISDNCVQTILHPMERKIDYTYNWNQWDLRKKALQYVDLLSKKTHSTQTDLSHFRRENHSQVYLPRNQGTQTRKDAGTNISRIGIPELYIKTKD